MIKQLLLHNFEKTLDDERGLTLIELIISMLIISILAVMYASSTTTSFKITSSAGEETIALNYARQKMEEIKALPEKPSSIPDGSFNPDFKFTVTMNSLDAISKLYKVSVNVLYYSGSAEKSVNLTTLIFWGK